MIKSEWKINDEDKIQMIMEYLSKHNPVASLTNYEEIGLKEMNQE